MIIGNGLIAKEFKKITSIKIKLYLHQVSQIQTTLK